MTWTEFNLFMRPCTEYRHKNRAERKKVYQQYNMLTGATTSISAYVVPLDNCVQTPIVDLDRDLKLYKQDQERDMHVSMSTNHDEALEHLVSRLNIITYDHKDKLAKHYNLRAPYPTDDKESEEWFSKGYFSFDEGYLRWGPKADREGYESAKNKMYDHKTKAEDVIRVKTDEDARLKALHDFESATFH